MTVSALLFCSFWREIQTYVLFAWYCFIVPLGDTKDQKARLDKVGLLPIPQHIPLIVA